MKIINKKNLKVIDKSTNVPLKDYASLTDVQFEMIEENQKTGNTVDDGFGGQIEEVYPVNMIKYIDFSPVENSILDKVNFIYFYEDQEKIDLLENYQNKLVNDSFHGKKYKFHVKNLDDLLPLSFSQIMLSIEKNKRIITDELPQYLENDIMIMPFNIYADNIKPSDLTKLNEAIAAGLIIKTENPFYNQF